VDLNFFEKNYSLCELIKICTRPIVGHFAEFDFFQKYLVMKKSWHNINYFDAFGIFEKFYKISQIFVKDTSCQILTDNLAMFYSAIDQRISLYIMLILSHSPKLKLIVKNWM